MRRYRPFFFHTREGGSKSLRDQFTSTFKRDKPQIFTDGDGSIVRGRRCLSARQRYPQSFGNLIGNANVIRPPISQRFTHVNLLHSVSMPTTNVFSTHTSIVASDCEVTAEFITRLKKSEYDGYCLDTDTLPSSVSPAYNTFLRCVRETREARWEWRFLVVFSFSFSIVSFSIGCRFGIFPLFFFFFSSASHRVA